MSEVLSSVYDYLGHSRETEIRIITQEGSVISEQVSTEADFIQVCEQWDGRANVYVGINERNEGGTRDQDVISVQTIVLDLDPIRPAGSLASEQQIESVKHQAEKIADWSVASGWHRPELVMSGNGIHVYFAIPPIQITDENRVEITIKLKLFEEEVRNRFETPSVKVDRIQNLSRIIRVPGSLSIKGDSPRRSYPLGDMSRREDGELLDFLIGQKMPVEEQLVRQSGVNGGETRQELCHAWNTLLLNGTNYSDRSEVLFLLATQLLSCGNDREDVLQILMDFDEKNGSKFSNRKNKKVQMERLVVEPAIQKYSLNPVSCIATQKLIGVEFCKGCTRDRIQAPSKAKWRRVIRESSQNSVSKSVESVRSEIRSQVMEHEDGILLIGSPPGSGKSTTSARALRDRECRVLYLAQRHALYDDIVENLGAIPIKGRHPENCIHHIQARDIGEKGWSVSGTLCRSCEGRRQCRYYQQFRETQSWVAPVQYLDSRYIWNQSFDILVLDEVSLQTFVKEQHIDIGEIHYARSYFADIQECNGLLPLLDAITHIITDTRREILKDLTGDELFVALHEHVDVDQIVSEYADDKSWMTTLVERIGCSDPRSLPVNFIEYLLDLLAFENALFAHGGKFNSRIRIDSKRLILYQIRNLRNICMPIIVIDGTMDERIMRSVFGENARIYRPNMKTDAKLIQIVDAGYGKRALAKENTRKRLVRIVNELTDDTTVCCSTKRFAKEHLKGESFYYWGQRGTNEYSDYRRVVLVGGANPNPTSIVHSVRALYYADSYVSDAGDYRWVSHKYVDPQGYGVDTKRWTYDDERIQGWIDSLSSAEMVQSIHRIRPLLDSEKEVYVLSNIPLEQVAPTKMLQLQELEHELGVAENNSTLIRNLVEECIKKNGRVSRANLIQQCRGKCSAKTVDRVMIGLQAELSLVKQMSGRERYWILPEVE